MFGICLRCPEPTKGQCYRKWCHRIISQSCWCFVTWFCLFQSAEFFDMLERMPVRHLLFPMFCIHVFYNGDLEFWSCIPCFFLSICIAEWVCHALTLFRTPLSICCRQYSICTFFCSNIKDEISSGTVVSGTHSLLFTDYRFNPRGGERLHVLSLRLLSGLHT